MAKNYRDTALNMYDSALLLFDGDQWHLSSYLAGYVLECTIKSVLLKKNPTEKLEFHLNQVNKDDGETLDGKIQNMINELQIKEPELFSQLYFLHPSSSDYPRTIIKGRRARHGVVQIQKWKSYLRYDQTTWSDQKIAEVFNKEIKIIKQHIDNLVSGGEMSL